MSDNPATITSGELFVANAQAKRFAASFGVMLKACEHLGDLASIQQAVEETKSLLAGARTELDAATAKVTETRAEAADIIQRAGAEAGRLKAQAQAQAQADSDRDLAAARAEAERHRADAIVAKRELSEVAENVAAKRREHAEMVGALDAIRAQHAAATAELSALKKRLGIV
jgi:F0F1-type ATP synthase membrane subunit b/b'